MNDPLNWEDKIDSPELAAWFQQFGLKYYLSAEQINQIRDRINFLLLNGGGSGTPAFMLVDVLPTTGIINTFYIIDPQNKIFYHNGSVFKNIFDLDNSWESQNLQSVLDVSGYAESTDENSYVNIDLDNGIHASLANTNNNTRAGFGVFKNGVFSWFASSFANTSLYRRLFLIRNIPNGENYITSELKDLSSAWIRRIKLNFLSTGLKISSRSDGSEIGVILKTDNLTADRTRQEQDKDGTYALLEATAKTGTALTFTSLDIYGTFTTPETANITVDLTNAKLGIVQKMYHQSGTAPTFPAGFVKKFGTYSTSGKNEIYYEWAGGTRVEYWILNI